MRQTRSEATPVEWQATESRRLDVFLATRPEVKSRSEAKRLVEARTVKVNGKVKTKVSLALKAGDTVSLSPIDLTRAEVDNRGTGSVPLEILYEDDDCLVLNKSAGVAVHPGTGMTDAEPTILHSLEAIFAKRALPFSISKVLVHRLDKETTGCLLIAKNPRAHMLLQKQFAERKVSKSYLALVSGAPSPPRAIIDSPIGRHVSERMKMTVYHMSRGREARTAYETLGSSRGTSLLLCDLLTGRTHQARVHLTSIGHPVLGDARYGMAASRKLERQLGIDFLCLHAWKLQFTSLKKKRRVEVESPLSKRFASLLRTLRLKV